MSFYLKDEEDNYYITYLYCSSSINLKKNCKANLTFYSLNELNVNSKTLYINDIFTNLNVTFNKPTSLKLYYFYQNSSAIYSYGNTTLTFYVNLNTLYKSIRIGNKILNCEIKDYDIHKIECNNEFYESENGEDLILYFNDEPTEQRFTIQNPPEFSKIYELEKKIYYINSSEQNIYFRVDCSYKMNEHSIVLVPFNSSKSNITLSNCTYFNNYIYYGKCLGLLNSFDDYYIFVDNVNSSLNISVFTLPTSLYQIDEVGPYVISDYLFGTEIELEVRIYFTGNLGNYEITLVNEYNKNFISTLSNCSEIKKFEDDNEIYEEYYITCFTKFYYYGKYLVYLNGFYQDDHIYVFSNNLVKALHIEPNLIRFESETIKSFEIKYDSDILDSKISLRGSNNNVAQLINYNDSSTSTYGEKYNITFPSPDIYYVYINDRKQNVSVNVTTVPFTSKIFSINPTKVNGGFPFILTVDTNLGIKEVNIKLKNKEGEKNYEEELNCIPDESNNTKAYCSGYCYPGEYNIYLEEKPFDNLVVNIFEMPELNYYFPNQIFTSKTEQTIIFIFYEDISDYANKVLFVNNNINVKPNCFVNSVYEMECSAVFKKEGNYYLTINEIYYDKFINVINDGSGEIDDESNSNEENNNNKNNSNNQNNFIKNTKILVLLYLLLF